MNRFFTDKQGNPLLLTGLQAHNSSTGTDMLDKAIHEAEWCSYAILLMNVCSPLIERVTGNKSFGEVKK